MCRVATVPSARTISAIPMYLHRKMLYLPVALNPKELVGYMSIAVLMATFPYTHQVFTISAIPMYLHKKMLHLPVALNPKELVGYMSIAALMATFHFTPSFTVSLLVKK